MTIADEFVLARSACHPSANCRSVVCYGRAEEILDPEEQARALGRFTGKLVPGRSPSLRPMLPQEVKGTMILRLPLEKFPPRWAAVARSTTRKTFNCQSGRGCCLPAPWLAKPSNLAGLEIPAHVLQMMRDRETPGAEG